MTARPAFELADVFRRHGETYAQLNAGHLGRVERRVTAAIAACRTAALGGHVERCDDCGLTRIAYNSCRNRHCPKCQGAARAQWLAARQAELLPVPYFHVVFTLPPAAAEIAFQNKRTVYGLLMRAAAQALTVLAAKRLGHTLMTQTDPQHWLLTRHFTQDCQRDSRFRRRARPRRNDYCIRLERTCSGHIDFVIAPHHRLHAQLAEVLHQVVGK